MCFYRGKGVSLKKKHWIKIGIFTIICLLIIDIVASFFFYNLAIKRGPKDFLQGNADLEVSSETMDVLLDGDWRKWDSEQDFEEMSMRSFDDLNLKGYFLEAKEPTNKVVVFAHGYLGRASDMSLFGQYYYEELGYNMFTADARGHGQSEGDYYGFGWHDRLDYVGWINQLVEKLGPDTEIVLHGLSMGAATVLMTSGEKLPDNVKAVVADSPYTSVNDLFKYQLKRMFKLPAFPVLNSTSAVTKLKAGYGLKEASALKQVEKTSIPILYIHGEEDTFVPTKLAHKLYEQTNSEAELVTFEGANHGESFVIEKDKYIKHLNRFLDRYID